jgi:SAM-dependent methyltransferase
MELCEQEKNILYGIMAFEQQQQSATVATIINTGRWGANDGDEAALFALLGRLAAAELILQDGSVFNLTRKGLALTKQLDADEFGQWMAACECSPAYHRFCQLVYGADRCHFNMLTQSQFEKLLEILGDLQGKRVLDLDELHLPDNSFDAILAVDSLYFSHDLNQLIAALPRCLHPGGC